MDWALLILLTALVFAFPIRTGITKELALALGALSWIGGLILFRRSPLPWLLSGTALGVLAWIGFAPARSYDHNRLRAEYVRNLRLYNGAKYVWGGETGLGIDCSGLIREGMIMADLKYGIATGNPALLREAAAIWWRDCSAVNLGEGYSGRTDFLKATDSLKELDYSALLPGDIAVTEAGAHVLAYVGQKTWIEADPNALTGDKVIEVTASQSRNAWLDVPMRIMRWRDLA